MMASTSLVLNAAANRDSRSLIACSSPLSARTEVVSIVTEQSLPSVHCSRTHISCPLANVPDKGPPCVPGREIATDRSLEIIGDCHDFPMEFSKYHSIFFIHKIA